MKRKVLFLLVLLLPVLAFSVVPRVHAGCGDAPLPSVDYSGCPLAGADFSGWIAEETDRLQYGWASTVAASRFGERRFRPDMRCSESSDIAVAASRLHFAAD